VSIIGKRTIYVGPAGVANCKPLNVEGVALSASTLPGSVIEQAATGLQLNSRAATVFGGPLLVADKDQQRTRSVDDAWTQNENMVAIQPRSGEFFNAIVADGNNITTKNTALSWTAAGKLAIAATDGTENIVAYSDEIVNVSGADALVRCRAA